jgi:hypothetical protein
MTSVVTLKTKMVQLGGETPSWIRAWSLICNKNPIVFFERHCYATERSKRLLHVQGVAGHAGYKE